MKLVLVEDDSLQAEWMMKGLANALQPELELIPHEEESGRRLGAIASSPPDIFVIDVILRWTDPHPRTPPPPPDVVDEGRERAGFRCWKRLADLPSTRAVPVILYSFLDGAHFPTEIASLPPTSIYLRKEADLRPLY